MTVEQTGPRPVADAYRAGCAWIDGEYVPIADARIPILDTGFTKSDLTYDVAGVWDGRFFRIDDHLERLANGARKLRLALPRPIGEIREIMLETVRRTGLRDAYVSVIVTRGVPGPGERDPRLWTSRLYTYAIPYVWIVAPDAQDRGADVVVARDVRRIPAGSVDPTVKNFHWGDLVRGLFEAYDRKAWLAILTDADALITEGAGFNVFAVIDGVLRTPARGVLEGITRRTVLEMAADLGLSAEICDIRTGDLYRSSEMFLTSTAGGVMPVATLDGEPVGAGVPGPVTIRLRARYWELHTDPRFTVAIDAADRSVAAGGPRPNA